MLLHQLLTRSDTDAGQFRKGMRAYNTVLSMASKTRNWVSRALESSNFNSTMTAQGEVYRYIGLLFPSQQIEHSYATVYAYDTDEVDRTTIRGSNVSHHINESILIDLGAEIF